MRDIMSGIATRPGKPDIMTRNLMPARVITPERSMKRDDKTRQEVISSDTTQIPGGQSINVVTNHNIHLDRKEWMFRGIVGGIGNILAFPFRLIGNIITKIFEAIIGALKIALLIVMVPTLIWLGLELKEKLSEQESVEAGAQVLIEQAGEVANGTKKAISGTSE